MYSTVPISMPCRVPVARDRRHLGAHLEERRETSFARPKSRILTKSSWVTITFSGLRSRWTMPAAWAFARPSAIWRPSSDETPRVERSASARTARSVRPLDELHDDVVASVLGAPDVVDVDDVGMVQRRGRERFLLEAAKPLGVGSEGAREELERHVATELSVAERDRLRPSRPLRAALRSRSFRDASPERETWREFTRADGARLLVLVLVAARVGLRGGRVEREEDELEHSGVPLEAEPPGWCTTRTEPLRPE